MKKSWVLYLGAHKTATTFIQQHFDERREELAAKGVTYIGTQELRKTERIVFPTPRDVREGLDGPIRENTRKEFSDILRDCITASTRRVLMSEENITGSPRLNIRRATLYPALKDRLRCLPPEWFDRPVEIFFCIRNYADYFAACHNTIAAVGDWMDMDRERRARIVQLPRRWTDVVRDIRDVFPNADITVWRHEDMDIAGPEIVNQMVGSAFPIDFSHKGTMASLSAEGLKQIHEAWLANESNPLDRGTVRRIREETQGGRRADPWSRESRALLGEAYDEDWKEISQSIGESRIIEECV